MAAQLLPPAVADPGAPSRWPVPTEIPEDQAPCMLTEKASCFCAMLVFLSLQSYNSSSSSQSLIHMISRDVAWMMFCSCLRWSILSNDAFCNGRSAAWARGKGHQPSACPEVLPATLHPTLPAGRAGQASSESVERASREGTGPDAPLGSFVCNTGRKMEAWGLFQGGGTWRPLLTSRFSYSSSSW